MGNVVWTNEQLHAINDRGGTLLVSAAAGSGKTAVLVERLLQRVIEDKVDIHEFLMITYTNAAASELRGKILDAIHERVANEPQNRHLARQLTMIHQARISTVHAYCTSVLRTSGHMLGWTSDFRIQDENESDLLRRAVLDELLEEHYTAPDEPFSLLCDHLCGERDDARMVETILSLHSKSRSHPNAEKWIEKRRQDYMLDDVQDVSETVWGTLILSHIREISEYLLDGLTYAVSEMQDDSVIENAYASSFIENIEQLKKMIIVKKWDEMLVALQSVSFSRLSAVRKPQNPALKEWVQAVRKDTKKEISRLQERYLCKDSNSLIKELRAVAPVVWALLSIVEELDVRYQDEKKRRGVLDYSDLEHFAVKLFVKEYEEEHDIVIPTPFAEETSQCFCEIMVDEYQDSNCLQDIIFRAISKNEQNLVMVGDLKQSIYRFRLADPTIFLKKYKTFQSYEKAKEGEPRVVTLSKNFRSRKEVLDACNAYFSAVMSEKIGELDYTEREYLNVGASYEKMPDQDMNTEMVVIDLEDENTQSDDELPPRAREVEARYIASRIQEMMHSGFKVKERPLRYDDVVILLRSMAGRAEVYEAALRDFDIPCVSDKGEGLLGTLEVSMLVSLLAVIDNPLQDVPLVASLRSPMFGFTADDLAWIRRQKDGTMFEALQMTAREVSECGNKCATFLSMLQEFRDLSGELTCDRLIWHVLDRTHARGMIGAMPEGVERVRRLERFYQYAVQYESAGFRGLHTFLVHITKRIERGSDLECGSRDATGNAVKIMTIHKSKGLEFPIVFLADCNRKFNRADLNEQVLIHPQLGLGMTYRDLKRMIEIPTIARNAVTLALDREMKGEELRVLYVGMTRAREKMILVCTLSRATSRLDKISMMVREGKVSPVALLGANQTDLWFLLPMITHAGMFQQKKVHVSEIPTATAAKEQEIRQVADAEMVRTLEKRFSFVYPHNAVINAPSKITVTEIAGKSHARRHFKRPKFIEKQGLSATERGIALHLTMQMIDFTCITSLESVMSEIERLRLMQLLSEEQVAVLDAKMIYRFFESSLGISMRRSIDIQREFHFSLLVDAGKDIPGEQMLLQGVIDLYFEDENGITIVDFKSDHSILDTAVTQYAKQLEIYAYALERILQKPVFRRVLYFLHAGKEIQC